MGLIDEARTAVRGAFCSVLNGLAAADRFALGLTVPGGIDPSFPGTPVGNIINNAQALFCDRPPFPTGSRIVGGQCVCVQYDTQVTVERPGFSNLTSGNLRVFGPITSLRIREFQAPQTTGISRTVEALCRGVSTCSPEPVYVSYATTMDPLENPSFNYIQRVGGVSDDCGNPVPPPLEDDDLRRPITINNNTGIVAFGFPILNINGDLQVAFELEVGELNLSGTVELNTGDINFNFGGQPTDPDAPQVPTPDDDVPPADDDDPEEDKKANIIGVVVVSQETNNPTATELLFPNSPNVFIPRTATVQFKIRIKNKSHWTSEIPVRSKNAYIHCPGDIDAIDVIVTSDPGWSVVSTPVRGIVPSNQVVLA